MASEHTLFRRCVQCPPDPPSCPACGPDETCSLQAQSCSSCASTTCVKIGSLPGQLASKTSTPIGPIVGGVVGGVVAIAVIVFLVWRFHFRKRKQAIDSWDPPEKRDQSTLAGGARQSTANSIASTVLTRASNVIQIAYIPGVTVRSPPDSPGLVPPMPSIPDRSNNSSATSTPHLEQHFFMPGDLRDSTWSDTSSVDPRISLAPSLTRASVATTMYRSDAIVPPVPAQQAFRAQANVVSVKSGANTPSPLSGTPGTRTPPVPQVPKLGSSKSSIVARTVTARPIEVKKPGSATRVPTLSNLARQASKKSKDSGSSTSGKSVPVYEEKEVVGRNTAFEDSPVLPVVKPRASFASIDTAHSSSVSAIMPSEGPLGSGTSVPTHRHSPSAALNAMIEEAVNRAARDPPHLGLGSTVSRPELKSHDSGPFSDANEVKENLP